MSVIKICDNCGIEFQSYACYEKRKRKHRFCSKECEYGFKNLNNTREKWKGGTISKTTGYKYIKINGKAVGEHVLVAEMKIGRRLEKGEVVHHINGVKTDNRPENLVILSNGEHVSLHKSKETETKCLRCGEMKKLHARGLCGTCYHYVFMRGELNKWHLSTNQSKHNAME